MTTDSLSSTMKTTKGMLWVQNLSQIIYGVGAFLLGGYSGAVQSVVSLLRNTVAIANIKSRVLEWLLIGLGVVFGLYFNNRGIVGLLPVIANSEYSIAIFRFKDNERALKISFLVCIVLFSIFNAYIMNYVGVVTNGVVFVSTAAFLLKKDKKQDD